MMKRVSVRSVRTQTEAEDTDRGRGHRPRQRTQDRGNRAQTKEEDAQTDKSGNTDLG